jgi:hypothetical protein
MVGELRVERKSDRTEGNKEKRRFRLDLPLLGCLLLSPINSVCFVVKCQSVPRTHSGSLFRADAQSLASY